MPNAQVQHTITQAEINQGWAVVHVNWRYPFNDTNYNVIWGLVDSDPTIDLSYVTGDEHNLAPDGFDAIVYMASAPVVQQSASDFVNVNVVKSSTATAPINTLYSVAIYADSRGDGGGTAGQDMLTITLAWTDPSGFVHNLVVSNTDIDGSILGSSTQVTKSIVAVASTPITVTSSFTGTRGNAFHYDMSVRLLKTPTVTPLIGQAGDVIMIQALASHN